MTSRPMAAGANDPRWRAAETEQAAAALREMNVPHEIISYPDEATIAAAPDQASVDLDDEAAILNLKTGIYFGLNEVGAWIWRLIQTPRTVGEIRAALLAEFEVEPEDCQRDLQALLQELAQNQLIEMTPARST